MGLLGNLSVQLNLVSTNFNNGLASASKSLNSFVNKTASGFRQVSSSASAAGNSTSVFAGTFNKNFKDISRIAQGIIVSQAFYKMTSEIKEASSALTQFSMDCEDAQVSFGILMKDSDKAKNLVSYLQDFAAATPFTAQQAISNARGLLAYGFNPDEMGPIMNSISDAAAASGDSQSFDRIARALGQIHTKGKLAQQEMLQLTEAGIPAFEILGDKLGLTREQLGEIGRQGISANKAITALLEGMNERYGGAGEALSNTTRGMLNTIKDDLLIIGNEIASGVASLFKWAITPIRDGLNAMRTVIRSSGLGGLMHSIIPPELMPQVQLLVANLMGLLQSFLRFGIALRPVISALAEFGLYASNFVLPIIQILAQAISMLTQVLTSNIPAVRMFVAVLGGLFIASKVITLILGLAAAIKSLFIVKVVAQGILYLAKAIAVLSMAIVRNPLVALLGLAAGGLLAFAMTSKKVGSSFTGLGNTINKAFGNDPSKIFQPKMEKNIDTASEFNKEIGSSADKLDDMGTAAKKAGDKAKQALMSFDEVFTLPDEDEASGSGSGLDDNYDIGDIGSPTIPDIDGSGMGLELPDWGGIVDDWLNGFIRDFKDKIKNTLLGAGIGALIGSVLGGILGGTQGAKIGAILGGLAGGLIGYFWDAMSDKQKHAVKAAGLGAAIGAVLGGIFGGPQGAAIGAILGAAVGGIVGYFWDDLVKKFGESKTTGAAAGATIGAIIGAVMGGPLGAAAGAAIGAGLGVVVGIVYEKLKEAFGQNSANGMLAGAAIGAIIGTALAGPLGGAIGAVIGGGLGTVVGKYWEELKLRFTENATPTGMTVGAVIGAIIGTAIGGPLGTAIGAAVGGGLGAVIGSFWEDLKTAYSNSATAQGATIGAIIGGIVGTIIAPGIGTAIGAAVGGGLGGYLGSQWESIKATLATWWTDMLSTCQSWWDDTKLGFSDWWTNVSTGFDTWKTNTSSTISNWWNDTKKGFSDWYTNTSEKLGGWWTFAAGGFSTWRSDSGKTILGWASDQLKNVSGWASDASEKFKAWWSDNNTGFETWRTETGTKLSTWWADNSKGFTEWWDANKKGFDTWSTETGKNIQTWSSSRAKEFADWWSNSKTGFSSWSSETASKVSTWASDTSKKFTDWKSSTLQTMSNWSKENLPHFSSFVLDTTKLVGDWYTNTTKKFADWKTEALKSVSSWWDDTKSGFSDWYSSTIETISSWASKAVSKLKGAVDKVKDAYNNAKSDMDDDDSSSSKSRSIGGHARGGIFNREHIANFAEGNRAEAIIPLENYEAMQPFVDAVAGGLSSSFDNVIASLASTGGASQPSYAPDNMDNRQILYVGTLIADDAGLKQLERKMRVITIQEQQRRGNNG